MRNISYLTPLIIIFILIICFVNIIYFSNIDINNKTYLSELKRLELNTVQNIIKNVENNEFFNSRDWQEWLNLGIIKPNEEFDDDFKDNIAHSEYAYVTLISGLDKTYKYRGFLYNTLIMNLALKRLGSTADFIAMIGLNNPVQDKIEFKEEFELLRKNNIKIYFLPRFVDLSIDITKNNLGFAEMALLKITPFSFTQYKKIQFLDGDIMPLKNLDCFFYNNNNNLNNMNIYTVGAASPLNSGWFLGIPNMDDYHWLKTAAINRLHKDWDQINGWGEPWKQKSISTKILYYRGERKEVQLWDFNSADMDQGLMCHYFILTHGNGILIDTEIGKAKIFHKGYFSTNDKESDPIITSMSDILQSCNGLSPLNYFAHFTGRSKPWMNIPPLHIIKQFLEPDKLDSNKLKINIPTNLIDKNGKKLQQGQKNILLWLYYLDELNLSFVNSTTIGLMDLGSPLGFFNAKFPKGGFIKSKD